MSRIVAHVVHIKTVIIEAQESATPVVERAADCARAAMTDTSRVIDRPETIVEALLIRDGAGNEQVNALQPRNGVDNFIKLQCFEEWLIEVRDDANNDLITNRGTSGEEQLEAPP